MSFHHRLAARDAYSSVLIVHVNARTRRPEICGALLLTFSADASQIRDLHKHLGEHVRFVRPPPPHVNLQRLQEGLLQDVHLLRLLQVLTIYNQNTQVQRKV